jgi:hypothetical protein
MNSLIHTGLNVHRDADLVPSLGKYVKVNVRALKVLSA